MFSNKIKPGFNFIEEEIHDLEVELMDEQGYVTIQRICEKVEPWHNAESNILTKYYLFFYNFFINNYKK